MFRLALDAVSASLSFLSDSYKRFYLSEDRPGESHGAATCDSFQKVLIQFIQSDCAGAGIKINGGEALRFRKTVVVAAEKTELLQIRIHPPETAAQGDSGFIIGAHTQNPGAARGALQKRACGFRIDESAQIPAVVRADEKIGFEIIERQISGACEIRAGLGAAVREKGGGFVGRVDQVFRTVGKMMQRLQKRRVVVDNRESGARTEKISELHHFLGILHIECQRNFLFLKRLQKLLPGVECVAVRAHGGPPDSVSPEGAEELGKIVPGPPLVLAEIVDDQADSVGLEGSFDFIDQLPADVLPAEIVVAVVGVAIYLLNLFF